MLAGFFNQLLGKEMDHINQHTVAGEELARANIKLLSNILSTTQLCKQNLGLGGANEHEDLLQGIDPFHQQADLILQSPSVALDRGVRLVTSNDLVQIPVCSISFAHPTLQLCGSHQRLPQALRGQLQQKIFCVLHILHLDIHALSSLGSL